MPHLFLYASRAVFTLRLEVYAIVPDYDAAVDVSSSST